MHPQENRNVFNPHDTARAESLTGIPLASFRQRLAAYAIDMVLIALTYLPAIIAFQWWAQTRLHGNEELYHSAHVSFRVELQEIPHVAWIVWLILYYGLIVWGTNGLTPGKKLLGIRVVSLVRERITLWQAIERALGYGASMLEAGSGFFQYFTARNRCCVHDRIAETIVIYERAMKKSAARPVTAAHAG